MCMQAVKCLSNGTERKPENREYNIWKINYVRAYKSDKV
jgi:hypothetical protein